MCAVTTAARIWHQSDTARFFISALHSWHFSTVSSYNGSDKHGSDLRGKGFPLQEFSSISTLFSSSTKGEGNSLFFMYTSRPWEGVRTVLLGFKYTILSPQGMTDKGQGHTTVTVTESVSGVQEAEVLRNPKTWCQKQASWGGSVGRWVLNWH